MKGSHWSGLALRLCMPFVTYENAALQVQSLAVLQHLGGLSWLFNSAGRLAATVLSEEGRKLICNPAKKQMH